MLAGGWVVAGWAGLAYGVYLTVIALRLPPGSELTGHAMLQPAFKASMGDGVVGVQTAERPAATVVVDNHGQVVANDRRPVDADRNVGEPVVANGPFLDP